ncbi:MAG: hypothetical protein IKT40_12300 [Bacilli bacterium]|nr:hypothetical protein [Bacilli bacterium]
MLVYINLKDLAKIKVGQCMLKDYGEDKPILIKVLEPFDIDTKIGKVEIIDFNENTKSIKDWTTNSIASSIAVWGKKISTKTYENFETLFNQKCKLDLEVIQMENTISAYYKKIINK